MRASGTAAAMLLVVMLLFTAGCGIINGSCDLRINYAEDPEEWQAISDTECSIRAVFGDDHRSVSVFEYRGRYYFFVLCMGGGAAPDQQGYYYMELSKEASDYWAPLIEQVRNDWREQNEGSQNGAV